MPVTLVRDRKEMTLKVKVGGLAADGSYSLAGGKASAGEGGRLGMVVETAPADALERLGISGGVVVRDVVPDSVAANSGVLPGDVITLLGSSPIKSVEAYEAAVAGLSGGSSVPLRLVRRGAPLFIGLKLKD